MTDITLYFRYFRRPLAAGIAGLLLVAIISCSQKQPVSFAASLANVDSERAVALSISYIDSIAQNTPAILATQIREIATVLDARGDHKAAMQVAVYPYGVDADQQPEIAERLLRSTLLPGKPAPPIIGSDGIPLGARSYGKQTIVFFYESRCRSCQSMISTMTDRYDELSTAGIRVITISSDRERNLFEEYAIRFPWPNKLCDGMNYDSPNFIAYGVANTPTIFLLEGGKVKDQYGSPEEIMNLLLKQN